MTCRKKKASLVNLLLVFFILTSLVFLPTLAQSLFAAQLSRVSVNVSPTALQILVSDLKESEFISVDVADPNDKMLHEESKQSPLTLTLAIGVVDGLYHYDVQVVDKESSIAVDRLSGMFTVAYGQILPVRPEDKAAQGLLPRVADALGRFVAAVSEFLVPEASAADVVASGPIANVFFNDNSNDATAGWGTNDYRLWVGNSSTTSPGDFRLYREDTFTSIMEVNGSGSSTNVENSLNIDSAGDLHFANNGMFFDRSAKRLGIGLTTPGTTVDAIGDEIRIRPSTAAGAKLMTMRVNGTANDLNSFNADLWIRSDFTGNNTYLLANRVGVGTVTPGANLHLVGTTFPAFKATRDVAFTNGDRGVAAFELHSSGDMTDGFGPSFEFWISDTGITANKGIATIGGYRDTCDTCGKFNVMTANAGTLTSRMLINHLGQVGFSTTAPRAGTAIDTSTGAYLSTGGSWVNFSSRQGKDNIQDLDAEKAVQTLEGLNPVTYTYKAAPQEHHVGFIAEDVPEIVATQERRGLSALDITAVLTKVVQEQQKTMQEQQETIKRLTERMAALERDMKLRGTIASLTDGR